MTMYAQTENPIVIEPGIYNMPDQQYFDWPAVSNSDLKLIARSPAHYWAAKRDPKRKPEEDTAVKAAGRALHCAVLEPEAYPDRYICTPADAPRRPTKPQINAKEPSEKAIISIEFWHQFEQLAAGKTILTREQYDEYLAIGLHIRNHPQLAGLLKDGLAEKCVFANDPETGVPVKCKTDYYRHITDKHVICDLKKTKDARPFQSQKSAYDYNMFQQAAYYIDVWKWAGIAEIDTWIIAAVEQEPPHAVKLYEVSGQDIVRGREKYRAALNTYAECLKSDTWPAYSTDIEPLHYPGYAKD